MTPATTHLDEPVEDHRREPAANADAYVTNANAPAFHERKKTRQQRVSCWQRGNFTRPAKSVHPTSVRSYTDTHPKTYFQASPFPAQPQSAHSHKPSQTQQATPTPNWDCHPYEPQPYAAAQSPSVASYAPETQVETAISAEASTEPSGDSPAHAFHCAPCSRFPLQYDQDRHRPTALRATTPLARSPSHKNPAHKARHESPPSDHPIQAIGTRKKYSIRSIGDHGRHLEHPDATIPAQRRITETSQVNTRHRQHTHA